MRNSDTPPGIHNPPIGDEKFDSRDSYHDSVLRYFALSWEIELLEERKHPVPPEKKQEIRRLERLENVKIYLEFCQELGLTVDEGFKEFIINPGRAVVTSERVWDEKTQEMRDKLVVDESRRSPLAHQFPIGYLTEDDLDRVIRTLSRVLQRHNVPMEEVLAILKRSPLQGIRGCTSQKVWGAIEKVLDKQGRLET